jgi:ribonucleotide reductase alpha subunit
MSTIPWGSSGYFTYKRTYARRLVENDPNSATEEFPDTVKRILKATKTQLNINFTQEELDDIEKMFLNLEGIVAGRFLWQLGTKTVDKLGLLSLQNCAFTVVDDPIRPFTWAMDALMLGSGVGYNIQREHVYRLPKPKKVKITRQDTNDADYIVPDSRQGWVELLQKVLEAHFVTGKSFSYSTICIRGKGTTIKGFGGLASGPEELCWGMQEINKLLNSRAKKNMRSIDCLDVMNIIGYIVVSGNVRRSAQIAIGDYDDFQFLNAKRWDLGNIPSWRAMSNNSVVCDDTTKLPAEFWEGYAGNGEPYGLINLKTARAMGRTGETQYPDAEVMGFNPCAEQSLAPYETCCLAEVYLPNIKTIDRLKTVVSYLYKINKHSLTLPCHLKETEEIVHKNMRMGIGVTGYLQATDEQRQWLPEVYEFVRQLDKDYSKLHGFNESIKITTVKPSGTLSLLAGVTSGAHPAFSQYYIRRIRVASNSNLIPVCKAAGYPIEFQRNFDGTDDRSTMIVSFPTKVPEGTILAKDMTAIDQLEVITRLQKQWSDNSVSVTIYYRKEELEAIKDWLAKNYSASVKTVSFLLHSEHGFQQAPMEEITKEVYEQLAANVKPIKTVSFKEEDIIGNDECATGVCPIK